ncbi:MAG: thiolase domain-containing protein [Sulfolobales archaeon]
MNELPKIALVGMGYTGFTRSSEHLSFREMVYQAAVKAYNDAGGIDPRRDVDAFISCQEDFWEGVSISDEFAPDQLGGVLKPVYTVTGDGLHCVANAYMMIRSGVADIVVVESHGKPSEIISMSDIVWFSTDPIYVRPLKLPNPHALQALEARVYMRSRGLRREDLGLYVIQSLGNALLSDRAPYAAKLDLDGYLEAEYVVDPLTAYDIARYSDAAIVAVVASEEIARKLTDQPVWIDGVGWATEISTISMRSMEEDVATKLAARMAYDQANVKDPRREFDFAEVDERYSYKAIQAIEALGLARIDTVASDLRDGSFSRSGSLPVNPSGGALGEGVPLEAHGLARLLSAYEQLRGRAGRAQLSDAEKAVVHGWRGLGTSSSIVLVLSR